VYLKSLCGVSLYTALNVVQIRDLNSLVKLVRVNITAEKGAIEGKEANGDC
jgi:hypothetical protein